MKTKSIDIGRLLAFALIGALLQAGPFARGNEVVDELEKSFPLNEGGRISLSNVNGKVRISTWDRSEVKLEAVKRGDTQAELNEVKIEIATGPDRIRINTRYPRGKSGFAARLFGLRKPNSTRVDYTLTVPPSANLDEISTINGSLGIAGVRGDVQASTVNGQVNATDLAGTVELSTVNGSLNLAVGQRDPEKTVSLKTVNGKLDLRLPQNANADLDATTVNGTIHADGELPVKKNFPIGQELRGRLGKGGAHISLSTVNGSIRVRLAARE